MALARWERAEGNVLGTVAAQRKLPRVGGPRVEPRVLTPRALRDDPDRAVEDWLYLARDI